MPNDIGHGGTDRRRCGRPDVAGLFVAEVDGFSARIAHRIVVPGRETKFVRILAPGVGGAALRNDRAEVRIGENVHPRRRRYLTGPLRNDVFATVGGESAQSVEQDQIAARRRNGRRGCRALAAARHQLRHAHFRKLTPVKLFGQRSPVVRNDNSRNRLEQNTVLAGDMLHRPHENAARPIDHAGLDARGDQSNDLFLQLLPVTGVILVPDHQIHRQPFQAPVGMGLYELAHEIDIGRVANLQQHDRQIAGDGVTPQPGLPTAILDEHGRVGAQSGIHVDDGTGEARIKLRIGLGGIELPQHHLAVSPRQVEDAVRKIAVLVFVDQAQGHVAGVSDAQHDIDRRRLIRIER